jgi:hypothetical protein
MLDELNRLPRYSAERLLNGLTTVAELILSALILSTKRTRRRDVSFPQVAARGLR